MEIHIPFSRGTLQRQKIILQKTNVKQFNSFKLIMCMFGFGYFSIMKGEETDFGRLCRPIKYRVLKKIKTHHDFRLKLVTLSSNI